MKIRATGTPEQIEILLERIPPYCRYTMQLYKQTISANKEMQNK